MTGPAPAANPTADVDAALDQLTDILEQARALPMSASCVVHRGELLALVDDARALLPTALAQAEQVLLERQALLQDARAEAERIVADATREQDAMVAATSVFTRAQAEADRMLADAHHDAEAMRLQTEDYVDAKLANFEIVLSKTLATVERGRARLTGRTELDELQGPEPVLPGGSGSGGSSGGSAGGDEYAPEPDDSGLATLDALIEGGGRTGREQR